jgi:hypothetical protein
MRFSLCLGDAAFVVIDKGADYDFVSARGGVVS